MAFALPDDGHLLAAPLPEGGQLYRLGSGQPEQPRIAGTPPIPRSPSCSAVAEPSSDPAMAFLRPTLLLRLGCSSDAERGSR
jgi:hypothetical protein